MYDNKSTMLFYELKLKSIIYQQVCNNYMLYKALKNCK